MMYLHFVYTLYIYLDTGYKRYIKILFKSQFFVKIAAAR